MKILFLDIDGVLIPFEKRPYYDDPVIINNDKVKILKNIIDKTQANIILSSDWRRSYSTYIQVKLALLEENLFIFDKTPVFEKCCYRSDEIWYWLENNKNLNIKKYAIIDDIKYACIEENPNSFFQTDSYIGLTEEIANNIVSYLNEV